MFPAQSFSFLYLSYSKISIQSNFVWMKQTRRLNKINKTKIPGHQHSCYGYKTKEKSTSPKCALNFKKSIR